MAETGVVPGIPQNLWPLGIAIIFFGSLAGAAGGKP